MIRDLQWFMKTNHPLNKGQLLRKGQFLAWMAFVHRLDRRLQGRLRVLSSDLTVSECHLSLTKENFTSWSLFLWHYCGSHVNFRSIMVEHVFNKNKFRVEYTCTHSFKGNKKTKDAQNNCRSSYIYHKNSINIIFYCTIPVLKYWSSLCLRS